MQRTQVKEGRYQFKHKEQVIYEWDQSLEEVNLYIRPPSGVQAHDIECKITSDHVVLRLKGQDGNYLNHQLTQTVVVDESYWMLDNEELNINLQKMKKGLTWTAVFIGHDEIDPVSQDEVQKKLLLERFQQENPGFDFSNAEFNGSTPDARTFMGGSRRGTISNRSSDSKRSNDVVRFKSSFRNTIYDVMKSRGWKESDATADWDIYWAERDIIYEMFDNMHLEHGQKVNHFRNGRELCRKDLLAKNLKRAKRQFERDGNTEEAKVHDFFPVTYVLPGDYALFVEEFKKNQGVWIMKPIGKAQGKGIFLFTKLSEISDWRTDFRWKPENNQVETYVVQRYISNPYLVGGKKFDLRLYCLVTSFSSLEVYIYRNGFARFSNYRYSNNPSDIANSFIHLTNVAIQKTAENYNNSHGGKWDLRSLKLYMMSKHGTNVTDKLFYDIQMTILRSLLCVQKIMISDKHCFELYGYDIMIDDQLKPWLIEVNASPSLSANTAQDYQLKCGMLNDMLDVIDCEKRRKENDTQIGGFDLVYKDGHVTPSTECSYSTFLGAGLKERKKFTPKSKSVKHASASSTETASDTLT